MKEYLTTFRAAVFALAVALAAQFGGAAFAQTVTQQPQFAAPRTVLDLGNGPTELMPLLGNGFVFTSQGSGIGSGTTTTVTLTATPTVPPCIGCSISGGTLTASSHVTAFNGTTTITTDTSQTVAASTPLSWGAACPVSTQAAPLQPSAAFLMLPLSAIDPFARGVPLFTGARVCAYGGTGPGLQFVNFAIGAH